MKKYLFFAVLVFVIASCSSDGTRELQIDELTYTSFDNRLSGEEFNPDEYVQLMSVLDVVPGKYELSWTLVHDYPQTQHYNISLKLRLRLKRHIDVKQELIAEVINGQKDHAYLSPFRFALLDENGNCFKIGAADDFDLTYNSLDKWETEGMIDKDQALEFLRFLQSDPGAEIDLTLNALGQKVGETDCINVCKSAKGIICVLTDNDKRFEWKFGSIE